MSPGVPPAGLRGRRRLLFAVSGPSVEGLQGDCRKKVTTFPWSNGPLMTSLCISTGRVSVLLDSVGMVRGVQAPANPPGSGEPPSPIQSKSRVTGDSLLQEKVHLLGSALGGFLAQKFAEFTRPCPRVASLVLCNTFTDTTIFNFEDSSQM